MNARVSQLLLMLMLAAGDTLLAQESCRPVFVDDRSVHTCVFGEGPMTVVLAAGAGQTSRTWHGLVPELSAAARVVTFDRPGLGQSEPGAEPRTPTRIARELRSVLETLGVEGSLILVGHSMGGLHVLRYASLFPEGVAGVAILDSPPAGFEEERLELLTSSERAERVRLLENGSAQAPATVRLEREGASGAMEWDFSTFPREIPLVVVAADSQDFGDLGGAAAHRSLWVAKSQQWLGLSDRAELLVAEGSGHMVHHDRRALVAGVIRRLLGGSRDNEVREPKPNE